MTVNKSLVKDDLYLAVNEEWLKQAEIPADRSSTGGFMTLRDELEDLLREDLSHMVTGQLPLENQEQEEMVRYYQLATDFHSREEAGSDPLQRYLVKIEMMEGLEDLQALSKEWLELDFPLPWGFGISADMQNAEYYALYLGVPSTILPDTTYYGQETGDQLLTVYQDMSQQVLEGLGFVADQASHIIQEAVAFDYLIKDHVKSAEELQDYTANYNPRTPDQVTAYSTYINLVGQAEDLVGQVPDQFIVMQPAYFEVLDEIVNPDNFNLLKSWMIVRLANNQAPYLSEDLRIKGNRYSQALSGTPQVIDQDLAAYRLTEEMFDQVLGDYYAKRYFGPQAREDVTEMVEAMIEVYKERLSNNSWLSQATIAKAITKLDAIDLLVGYPDDYPDLYRKLKIDSDKGFYDNRLNLVSIRNRDHYARWNQKVNPEEWHMSAATVNAYYSPSTNVICFPAAILQAPFYNLHQSRSANYGGIGAVIAHEISHAFDNNGAKFDETGSLSNWWTDEDYSIFNQLSQAMIEQWQGIPYAGGQVNGQLTVSENIADGGGLTAALEALKQEEDYNLEDFFYNWARIWCTKARPEYEQLLLAVDVHSPAPLRANVQVKNLDDFHETFNTQPGDGMYLAPEDRVVIW